MNLRFGIRCVSVHIEYLNHASVLLESGDIKLLFDPWFEGTAFSGGWGLVYDNPGAYARAAQATHLWISHWHSDHLHLPTLRKLAARNPRMEVLANVSANFSMIEAVRRLGFRRVRALPERSRLMLAREAYVTRYPTAGIDNMLHVQWGDSSILNYNDCNLPSAALRSLRHKMGRIDLLLTNYNHAGKLYGQDPPDVIKDHFWRMKQRVVETLKPATVIPFASLHYYRAPGSLAQNDSLLRIEEVEQRIAGDRRRLALYPGDAAELADGELRRKPAGRRAPENPREVHDYGPSVPWKTLREVACRRIRALRRCFLYLTGWLPPLHIRLTDSGRLMTLDIRRGGTETKDASPHIEAHSKAIEDWLGRPFADDTFFAGAHFGIDSPDTTAIERWALATLLQASHLDPVHTLRALSSFDGRRFLLNRREEAWATLVGRRFRAGQLRT